MSMNFLSKLLPPLPDHETSVKALTYLNAGGIPSFTYYRIDSPLRPNHVLVRVKFAALSPLDIKLLNSTSATVLSPGEKGIGRDFSGEIEEVGPNVEVFSVGDRVCGMYLHMGGQGTVASHISVNVRSDAICKIPDNLTDEEGAAFPLVLGAALQSFSRVTLDKDSWVCILGGSTAVGLFAVQLAKKIHNVQKVVVSASGESEQLVRRMGSDEVINYKRESVPGSLARIVNEGKKFQLILDCVGGSDVMYRWKELLQPRSSGSAYVTLVGDSPSSDDSIGGTAAYTTHPYMVGRKLFGGALGINYVVERVAPGNWINAAYHLLLAERVKVVIDSVYDWTQWKEAFEKVHDQKAHGKVLLRIEAF